jgi:hypothetical protein
MLSAMDHRRMRSIAKRGIGVSWAMALSFLLLAHPAHAAVDSEPGALLLQAVGAGFLGGLFAIRKTLKRSRGRVAAHFARAVGERASLSTVPGDVVEHAHSGS